MAHPEVDYRPYRRSLRIQVDLLVARLKKGHLPRYTWNYLQRTLASARHALKLADERDRKEKDHGHL